MSTATNHYYFLTGTSGWVYHTLKTPLWKSNDYFRDAAGKTTKKVINFLKGFSLLCFSIPFSLAAEALYWANRKAIPAQFYQDEYKKWKDRFLHLDDDYLFIDFLVRAGISADNSRYQHILAHRCEPGRANTNYFGPFDGFYHEHSEKMLNSNSLILIYATKPSAALAMQFYSCPQNLAWNNLIPDTHPPDTLSLKLKKAVLHGHVNSNPEKVHVLWLNSAPKGLFDKQGQRLIQVLTQRAS